MNDVSYIAEQYGWEGIVEFDNFLYVYDHLPPKMKLIVDLKMTGTNNTKIAELTKTTEANITQTLREAKKRFLRGENVI